MSIFNFEADFKQDLRCIPMQARMKLDTSGVKVKLSDWAKFSEEQKREIVDTACDTDSEVEEYKNMVVSLIEKQCERTPSLLTTDQVPDWKNTTEIHPAVLEKLEEVGESISLEAWAKLEDLQRFALIKLSRPSHENANFVPAMKEFGLI